MEANNKQVLETIAKNIINKANINNPECGSVILVLTVISVILSLIRVIQECNKKEQSTLSSKNDIYGLYQREIKDLSVRKGWFTKMRIKKLLKKELSITDYQKFGLLLTVAIMDSGENISMDETQALIEAANV
jgi:hypothetical protein